MSLTAREPQVGRTVVATVSDDDGGVALTRWTWATSRRNCFQIPRRVTAPTHAGFVNVNPDVTSGAYTPKSGDAGKCLRATATYKDNIPGDSATDTADGTDNDDDGTTDANMDGIDVSKVSEKPVQTSDPANAAPEFPDQDLGTAGDQSEMAMRSVAENKAGETAGNPVYADDTDGDALLYTLNGDDSASFKVDNNGQISTKVKLDFETRNEYTVALTATDPSGAGDSILVTISVIDGPDPAVIAVVTGPGTNDPEFPEDEDGMRSVLENSPAGTEVGAPVAATDRDADDTLTYTLGGADADSFEIDSATGQITVGAGTALDAEGEKTEYSVEVTATDQGENAVTIPVTITVEDVSLAGAGNDYDANSDEMIDRSEAIAAVMAYFGGDITKGEAVGVIGLYFSSGG